MLYFKSYTKEEVAIFKTVKQFFEKLPPISNDEFENAFCDIVAQNIDGGSEYLVVGDLFNDAIVARVEITFEELESTYRNRIVEHCESFMDCIQCDEAGGYVHDYEEIYNIIAGRFKAWIDDTFDIRFLESGYIDKETYIEEDNYESKINSMVKFTFDYVVFLKSVKLVNKTISNRKGSTSTITNLTITSENKDSCCLSNGDFNHFINAEIDGEGAISISIQYLLKLLPMYKGSDNFIIETISETESIINGGLKVKTNNNFNKNQLNNSIASKKELLKHPEPSLSVTLHYLMNDKDFIEYKESENKNVDDGVEVVTKRVENVSPRNLIETGVSIIEDEVKGEVLERLIETDLNIFEKVIHRLLRNMGYGDFVNTKKSSDGGIDGIINEDKLGLEKIYTQAKRYNENKVRERDIRNFIGAMSGDTTKGVFITTSSFDEGAVRKAKEAHHTIILIDGDKLVDLMYQYNVGIQVKDVYEVKELDNDFFEGE